ncbi:helix-turn-helix transcriptional regulator [Methylobacterium tardum]|uniref:helix-turn-helix transcriptional regulator n=1 Tax=Methylobacterium tardum TaxID=374432 RepID=UPI001EE0610E|nr:AlpA family phage regulatory protein [Methylobacterium tardum]URD34573.1 AlpA family phage regulatory protein [Methylobacterium tardum]
MTSSTSTARIERAPDGLPLSGFVRLSRLLAPNGPLPISKSSWWEGVRKGVYPQPIRLGKRITAWRASDIRALIERGVQP